MNYRRLMLVVAGLAWPLGFAPLAWWWVAPVCMVVLLHAAMQAGSVKRAAGDGFVFGVSVFVSGVHWLFISLHSFGGMPWPVAAGGVLALSLYMAIYPCLAAMAAALLLNTLFKKEPYSLWLAPLWASVWTASELARGWVFTGFPWLSVGDGVVDSPLAVWLPWMGATAVAWWLITVVSWLGLLVLQPSRGRAGQVASLLLLVAGGTAWVGQLPSQAHTVGTVQVAIGQPNISQTIKFDPDRIIDNVITTLQVGQTAAEKLPPGGWLLLPETALPVLWGEAPVEWRDAFQTLATKNRIHLVMGVAIDENEHYTNSVTSLNPADAKAPAFPVTRYDKRHLVPFGEFIPTGFRWFVAMMNMPLGDFDRGRGAPSSFKLGGFYLLPNVCYEDVFSREFAGLVSTASPEPNALFNVSNLAWFGDSWAMDQHAQMSRSRAVEHQKPMIRATNTGVSGVIDASGHWLLRLPANQLQTGAVQVPLMAGLTFFARHGEWIWLAFVAISALLAVGFMRRAGYNSGL